MIESEYDNAQPKLDPQATSGAKAALTITEINQLLNLTLERACPTLSFEGELATLQRATSGHVYLSLKDERSTLSAVMWAGVARGLKFQPQPGMRVFCIGKPNVYQVTGRLQLVLSHMRPAGEGELQRKLLELKAKLEREGFFAAQRKRALPFLPRAVGIVTSRTGAVIHDIMVRARERMPCVPLYLVDVRVQGEGAAQEIADGLDLLSNSGLVDVIIVGRGGGSLQDLWAFNEEPVVKAIFRARVPVVAAVGHEVDLTLADLVADLRAPTPTAAAEMVLPKRVDLLQALAEYERRLDDTERWLSPLLQQVDELEGRLQRRCAAILQEKRLQLATAEARVRLLEPGRLLLHTAQKIELLAQRLTSAAQLRVRERSQQLQLLERRFARFSAQELIRARAASLDQLELRLQSASMRALEQRRGTLERLRATLEALSPRRTLERGFAIVEAQGKVLSSARQLCSGQELRLRFAEGCATAQVLTTSDERK